MIKASRYLFLWLFLGLFIFGCSKEKEPEPEPIPEDTKTTREYLADKAQKQVFTFDANSPLRIVTANGVIIEAQAGIWKDYLEGTAINGTVQLEVMELFSNKDFILNHLSALNPYMNRNNGILRFEGGFLLTPTQSNRPLSAKVTVKVPLKDPAIIAGNQAQLVLSSGLIYYPDKDEYISKWAQTGPLHLLYDYFPQTITDNITGKQYYEVRDLELMRYWLGVGDNWPQYGQGTISCGVSGKWVSSSTAKPAIYIFPGNHLCPQKLEISGNLFMQRSGEGIFSQGMDLTLVGIQYDKGKIFFAKKVVKVCSIPQNFEFKLDEVSEQVLMSELDAL